MRREACRDSVDVFLHIQETYPAIERFSFAVYRRGRRAKERSVGWQTGQNIGELFRADAHDARLSLGRCASREELLARIGACDTGISWGLWSRVSYGGVLWHIPLLDLTDRHSADVARSVLSYPIFGQPHGFVLASGNGLHGIGTRLLTQSEFRIFCGNALLASDIVDKRYIGHCLRNGEFCLRLATRTEEGTSIPQVLRYW